MSQVERIKAMPRMVIDYDYEPPDHPYDPERSIDDTWCADCGESWVAHDGRVDRLLAWMAKLR